MINNSLPIAYLRYLRGHLSLRAHKPAIVRKDKFFVAHGKEKRDYSFAFNIGRLCLKHEWPRIWARILRKTIFNPTGFEENLRSSADAVRHHLQKEKICISAYLREENNNQFTHGLFLQRISRITRRLRDGFYIKLLELHENMTSELSGDSSISI